MEEFNVKYKKDKNITTISVTLDMLLKANILKKVDDSYKFSFEYLYYFYIFSYYSPIFSNPGISFPDKNSKDAPPPVEI